jgi:hypothetical protein
MQVFNMRKKIKIGDLIEFKLVKQGAAFAG